MVCVSETIGVVQNWRLKSVDRLFAKILCSLSAKDRISNLFATHINAAETPQGRWGCLLCNAAIDQAPFDKDVEDKVSASISRLRNAIEHCLKGTTAQDKADLIWISYFGAHVMVKAGYSKSVFKKVQKDVLALF